MKKGGIHDVNGFISIPSDKTKPVKSSLKANPSKPTENNSSDHKSNKKPTVQSSRNVAKSKTSTSFNASRSKSKNENMTIGTLPVQQKNSMLRKRPEKVESIQSKTNVDKRSSSEKPTRRNFGMEEKRGTVLKKTTMEDVYKNVVVKPQGLENKDTNVKDINETTPEQTIKLINALENNSAMDKTEVDHDDVDADYEYEEDFESYESDFESYSGSNESVNDTESPSDEETRKNVVEEEKKMDSGNYDLQRVQKPKSPLESIRESLNKENMLVRSLTSANTHSLVTESHVKENNMGSLLLDFNKKSLKHFSDVKERHENNKVNRNFKLRSEKLLEMITLDTISYTLYEMIPIPYEEYMKFYAAKNSMQAFTQTNEDNTSIEVQTDDTQLSVKWTQMPPTVTKQLLADNSLSELLGGVGSDESIKYSDTRPAINFQKFTEFMKYAGEEMLMLLEDESAKLHSQATNSQDIIDTGLSTNVMNFRCNSVSVLQDSVIKKIVTDSYNALQLLTIHEINSAHCDECRCCCLISIWNIRQPSRPKHILKSFSKATCCCVGFSDSSVVVVGHEDGSICIWDTNERQSYYQTLNSNNCNWNLRAPSFNTAEMPRKTAHCSSIINVAVKADDEASKRGDSCLVYSAEEDNVILIWTLFKSSKISGSSLTPWSKLKCYVNQRIDIKRSNLSSFQITKMSIFSNGNILSGSNSGAVISCSSYSKKQKEYSTGSSTNTSVSSLEVCPYNENTFAVGYINGSIEIYDVKFLKPIVRYEDNAYRSAVETIQWLSSNTFITLNCSSLLCMWKFEEADIEILHQLNTDKISSVQSIFDGETHSPNSYNLVLVVDGQSIQLEKL